jgi:hypothetical protein
VVLAGAGHSLALWFVASRRATEGRIVPSSSGAAINNERRGTTMNGWAGFWLMIAVSEVATYWFVIERKKLQMKGAKFRWWE